ncbi:murein L,D-transpeptidase catalytic domain-containing protein [Sphingomonas oligophenolica]|uniref:Murein L,D-transpeptidase catalytic domain-containing protein n=1 Tax=Sphingomonas oligophenolica TaxID=301154 RepID=A0ABU9Y0M1_9SPHN
MAHHDRALSRRTLIKSGLAVAGAAAVAGTFSGAAAAQLASPYGPLTSSRVIRPELLRAALVALARHVDRVPRQDRIAIADFSAPSSAGRFHLVDVATLETTTFLVSHGKGSDPARTGWLQLFSNDPGSYASSDGAFLAADYYEGKHGTSQRLIGLDATNSNALDRAIVIHSAWYANPDMLTTWGQLGRSEGCFAVGEGDLAQVFDRLGQDRMLFSAKV